MRNMETLDTHTQNGIALQPDLVVTKAVNPTASEHIVNTLALGWAGAHHLECATVILGLCHGRVFRDDPIFR